jgi:hypothetical protein
MPAPGYDPDSKGRQQPAHKSREFPEPEPGPPPAKEQPEAIPQSDDYRRSWLEDSWIMAARDERRRFVMKYAEEVRAAFRSTQLPAGF